MSGRSVGERHRYRKVSVRMYNDEKFRALSPQKPSGQTLFLYLITGPHTLAIPGLIHAGIATLAERLGWPHAATMKCWREIEAQEMGQLDATASVIWLPNAIRHNPPESPNVVLHWGPLFDEIPDGELKTAAIAALRGALVDGFDRSFVAAFDRACGKPLPAPSVKASEKPLRKPSVKTSPHPSRNQEQEQEQEQESTTDGTSQDCSGSGPSGPDVAAATAPPTAADPEPQLDVEFRALVDDYPPSRRAVGHIAEQAYVRVVTGTAGRTEAEMVALLRRQLEQHKRSAEWARGIIPSMLTWLEQGYWSRELPETEAPRQPAGYGAAHEMDRWWERCPHTPQCERRDWCDLKTMRESVAVATV